MKTKNSEHNYKVTISGLLLILSLCFIFLLVYKAQIAETFNDPVTCVLKSLHKPNGTTSLSDENPILSQTFTCTVPSLKKIRVECQGENINDKATVLISVSDADTNEEYYCQDRAVTDIANGTAQKTSIFLKPSLEDSEGKELTLSFKLINGNGTIITFTSNTKQGIVKSFNNDVTNKTNIIYDMAYSNCSQLWKLYAILCTALLIFALLCFYLFIIRKATVNEAFIPLALALGLTFNFVIMVNGVPDEPTHIDTAYKYSDMILFTNTGVEGTIYKRQCDIEMTDMLVNGVESNSYYQLLHHFFEIPENTELVSVTYQDAGHIVPGIVYIPAAIGISLGRLLGLSALFTLSLGRIINLITFVLLIQIAIRLIPYGKNMLASVMLLPISLQQAASLSYDAVINGVLILFIALCFNLAYTQEIRKRKLVLLAALAIFVAMTKGGVYLPLCLLIILIYCKNRKASPQPRKISPKSLVLALCIAGILVVVLLIKYSPLFAQLLENVSSQSGDSDAYYSISFFIRHPAQLLYLCWNTFIKLGSDHMRGLLGGMLGWLDFKINWIYLIILYDGLLLLSNVEDDRYSGTVRDKLFLAFVSASSVALIALSMIVSFTSSQLKYIDGLQGRYYLVLFPLLLFLTTTKMIHVNREQCRRISMVMMCTEIMIILNTVALV